jgi:hypothetical protein
MARIEGEMPLGTDHAVIARNDDGTIEIEFDAASQLVTGGPVYPPFGSFDDPGVVRTDGTGEPVELPGQWPGGLWPMNVWVVVSDVGLNGPYIHGVYVTEPPEAMVADIARAFGSPTGYQGTYVEQVPLLTPPPA